MGHSAQINEGTYQRPLPLMAITEVGSHLLDIDKQGDIQKGYIKIYIFYACFYFLLEYVLYIWY